MESFCHRSRFRSSGDTSLCWYKLYPRKTISLFYMTMCKTQIFGVEYFGVFVTNSIVFVFIWGGGGDPLLLLLFILSVNVRALVKSAVTCVVLNLSYLKSLTGESLRKTSSHLHLEPSWARSHPSSSDTEGSVCVVDRRSHPVMFRPNLLSLACSMFVCTLSLSRPKTLQKADDGCQKTLKTYLKLDWHNVRSSLYRREQPSTSLIPTGRH